ncbi:hypothetical protein [Mycobacteroides abscessus]|uniref:hypothetical protein n=1 Tax=Mycobacteroides abscessus TaxID=36809 RepID=UPI0009292753|nr:hypothetical protein [Mycobacteroides abscessus]SHY74885.1 Uncharacterised protein [Mycobacteroides abscessus subsp. abscessus]
MDWCRMRGIYAAILKSQCGQEEPDNPDAAQALFVKRICAAHPITVPGAQLDLFNGPVPSATEIPMFTDRHIRTYLITADDKIRPADQERHRA